jgi:hypothetical protein
MWAKKSMIDLFELGGGSVLGQEWGNGVLLGVQGANVLRVSLVVDWYGFLVDGGGGFGSGEEPVEDLHTRAHLLVQQIKSFLLALLFCNIEWTEVEP